MNSEDIYYESKIYLTKRKELLENGIVCSFCGLNIDREGIKPINQNSLVFCNKYCLERNNSKFKQLY